jgi:hypothetical protein
MAHQKNGFGSERKFYEYKRKLSHIYIASSADLQKGRHRKDV